MGPLGPDEDEIVEVGPTRRPIAVLTLSRGVAAGLSFAWLIVAARFLSPREFADLAIILAVGAIVTVISDAGYVVTLNHFVAESGLIPKGLLSRIERRRVALALVATLIAAIAYLAVAEGPSLAVPLLYGISLISTAVYTTGTAALRGLGLVGLESANEIGSRTAILVIGTGLLWSHPTLISAVFSYAVCDLGSAVVVAILSRKRETQGVRLPPESTFAFSRIAPLAASNLLGNLYNKIDIWLLAGLSTSNAVALYAACYRIHEGTLIPSGAQAALALRRTSLAGSKTVPALRRLVFEAAGLAGVFAATIGVAAPVMLRLTFGPSFASGASILRVLMIAAPASAVVTVLAPYCAVKRRQLFAISIAVALTVDVGLNVVAIRTYGALGAAWATVASALVLAWSMVWIAFRAAHRSSMERERA